MESSQSSEDELLQALAMDPCLPLWSVLLEEYLLSLVVENASIRCSVGKAD
jgi:hypothetical protein